MRIQAPKILQLPPLLIYSKSIMLYCLQYVLWETVSEVLLMLTVKLLMCERNGRWSWLEG